MKSRMIFLLGVLVATVMSSANAADPSRGRALYEVRCVECHTQSVHGRPKRVAKNYEDIRVWVIRWNNELGGYWGREEIEDVTAYLNERFYSYPCTGLAC